VCEREREREREREKARDSETKMTRTEPYNIIPVRSCDSMTESG